MRYTMQEERVIWHYRDGTKCI